MPGEIGLSRLQPAEVRIRTRHDQIAVGRDEVGEVDLRSHHAGMLIRPGTAESLREESDESIQGRCGSRSATWVDLADVPPLLVQTRGTPTAGRSTEWPPPALIRVTGSAAQREHPAHARGNEDTMTDQSMRRSGSRFAVITAAPLAAAVALTGVLAVSAFGSSAHGSTDVGPTTSQISATSARTTVPTASRYCPTTADAAEHWISVGACVVTRR